MKKTYISPDVEVVSLNNKNVIAVTSYLGDSEDSSAPQVSVSNRQYDGEFGTREFTFDTEDYDEGGFDW